MKKKPDNKGNRWKDKKGSVNSNPDSNVFRAYNYFINKGLTPEQASGIVGNLAQESTVKLDSSIENSIGAFGIAQWLGSRRKDLNNFAKENQKKPSDFDLQLDFIWHELNTTEKRAYNKLKEAKSVTEAAEVFVNKFERSGEKKGDAGYDRRINYAKQFYTEFNGVVPVSNELEGIPDVSNTVTSVPTISVDNFNSNDFVSEFNSLEQEVSETEQRRLEKIKETEYKQALQNKINQRQFLTELVDSMEVPFIEAERAGVNETFQNGGISNERAQAVVQVDGTYVKPIGQFKKIVPQKGLTLEEQEEQIRNKQPDVSMLEVASDFIKGNVDEYIVNPAKSKISEYLPKSLKYDPELTTTRSNYDNTEGSKKYLLNNKTISDIRKEKNISYAQISNSKESNHFIPLKLKKRIVNSIYPQGYEVDPNAFFDRFNSKESFGDEQIKKLKGKRGNHREDIFLMYSGLPQKHDSFTISSFKAGTDSDTNVTFKDPDVIMSYLKTAALRTDLFDKLKDGSINPESIREANSSEQRGAEKIHKASFRDPQNVMWNATFGIGYDDAGQPYLSFYDNWDLAGKDDNVLTKGVFGSPIEIYDRIPLTDKLINQLARTKLVKQSDDESDAINNLSESSVEKEFRARFPETEELKYELNKVLHSIRRRFQ